jgi:hypothetical protein
MCILSNPAYVRKTNLLAAIDAPTGRQYVAYANQVHTTKPDTRMILAVPNPATVQFHDLTDHPHLFAILDQDFLPHVKSRASCNSKGTTSFAVGSYVGQLYATFDDLCAHEDLTDELRGFLGKHYTSAYGFLAFQLKSGDATYHPFAYSHRPLHTTSWLWGTTIPRYVVPTLHFHGDRAEDYEAFDHGIYLYGFPETTRTTAEAQWALRPGRPFIGHPTHPLPGLPDVRWNGFAALLEIRGTQRNVDLCVDAHHPWWPFA